MTKRAINKEEIRRILRGDDLEAAMAAISRMPPRKIINILISLYCDSDPLTRWRAVDATGWIVSGHAETEMESARVIMRRLLWMLNDESGGIGWGVPEAMGTVMARHDGLAKEYGSILLSYIEPDCNFLEHPLLQRGVLWGIGMLARSRPEMVRRTLPRLGQFFGSGDPWHRGYAARAAGFTGEPEILPEVDALKDDNAIIDIYEDGLLKAITVGGLALAAANRLRTGKES